jgi:hypothetical protein
MPSPAVLVVRQVAVAEEVRGPVNKAREGRGEDPGIGGSQWRVPHPNRPQRPPASASHTGVMDSKLVPATPAR